MKKPPIFWICPDCNTLNIFDDAQCKKCNSSLNPAPIVEEDYPGSIIPRLVAERQLVCSPRVGNEGFYFRARSVRVSTWWSTLPKLADIARAKHLPMSEIMKGYKRIKDTGLRDGALLDELWRAM